jgi:hypothetical protein
MGAAAFFSHSHVEAEALSLSLLDALTYPFSKQVGKPKQVKHCREAPGGCEARVAALAGIFVAAGATWGIDPYLLAGMALKESGLNPWAEGAGKERGVLQLHPARADARKLRFFADPRYRRRCERKADACQVEVVYTGAAILRRAFDQCGKVRCALCLYNTGKPHVDCWYAQRVLQLTAQLKGAQG